MKWSTLSTSWTIPSSTVTTSASRYAGPIILLVVRFVSILSLIARFSSWRSIGYCLVSIMSLAAGFPLDQFLLTGLVHFHFTDCWFCLLFHKLLIGHCFCIDSFIILFSLVLTFFSICFVSIVWLAARFVSYMWLGAQFVSRSFDWFIVSSRSLLFSVVWLVDQLIGCLFYLDHLIGCPCHLDHFISCSFVGVFLLRGCWVFCNG